MNSLKLAVIAFVIVVPLAIFGGVIAGPQRGQATTASSRVGGLSLDRRARVRHRAVLILVFGVWLGWLPVTATAPPGPTSSTQV